VVNRTRDRSARTVTDTRRQFESLEAWTRLSSRRDNCTI
jgi:hypothetical protein